MAAIDPYADRRAVLLAQIDVPVGRMWGKLGGRRIEFHGGRPLDSVKSQIEEADGPIGNQFDVQGAVAFALLAANLEEIGEIGRVRDFDRKKLRHRFVARSEEHTSELQTLMRTSYAVFCLKKKRTDIKHPT